MFSFDDVIMHTQLYEKNMTRTDDKVVQNLSRQSLALYFIGLIKKRAR